MKKILLSLFVIFTFGFYVFYQKQAGPSLSLENNVNNFPTTNLTSPNNNATFSSIPNTVKRFFREDDEDEDILRTIPRTTPLPIASNTVVTTNFSTDNNAKTAASGQYKDGVYNGAVADAYYGNIQVQAIISGGKLTDIKFLDYPRDRDTSIQINSYALPILRTEAIQAQSANVNGVSGASDTSPAFVKSLSTALAQAKY